MSHCFACLSTDRTLSTLDPHIDVCAKLFENVLKNIISLRVCWECEAKLKSIKCFQIQVEQAEKIVTKYHYLNPMKLLPTLSKLTVCKLAINTYIDGNIEYKNEEPQKLHEEPKIKLEDTDNLKEELLSDQEITYDDCIDDIPLEQILQTEIKKETKSKLKRKRSKSNKHREHNGKIWALKKPSQVTITLDKAVKCLENERKSLFLQYFLYKCEDCAIGYSYKKSYVKHKNVRHDEKNPHTCEICQRRFRSVFELDSHKLTHRILFKCKDCGYNSVIKNHMLWHLKQEHSTDNKRYSCDYCVTKFSSKFQLSSHMTNFHNEFICDYCGFKGGSKHKINIHITNNHGPKCCNICNKTFKNCRYLKIHNKMLHTVEHDESSYCVQCDIQFDNVILFKRHVNTSVKHKAEVKGDVPKKTFPCSECGKVYLQRYGMRNHYRLVHLKTTKYYCEECDLHLLNRTTFLRHYNKHRGIPLVKNKFCDICGRGFHTNRILINHIRTHTGERPHECPHCDAKFAQKTAMTSHVKHIHLKVERRRQYLS